MSDPAIKLFGRTIALPWASKDGRGGGREDEAKGSLSNEAAATKVESPSTEENTEPIIIGAADDWQKPPSSNDLQVTTPEKDSNAEKEQNDSGNSHDKMELKKPDKILPCPRCNSMDTKFCYYNNYNVSQPRHFCKNCQRYWTAGGSIRNVPVGAGRRKNKNPSSSSQYRQLAMSEAATLSDQLIYHHPALNPNGTVLRFGPNNPLCESMASVLNLTEQTAKNCTRNGFHQREEQVAEERSNVSSLTASNSSDGSNLPEQTFLPPPQLSYMNASPWPYPWSPPPPPPPPPGSVFCASNFPLPYYPAVPYWGCSGPWSIPWPSPHLTSPPTPPITGSSLSGPNSPTLGKHLRDGDVLFRNNNSSDSGQRETVKQEKCLWIPKTLRIDDPEEAARSSFWATLGFKNDKRRRGLFKPFQTKDEISSNKAEASPALHANPAAMSRSINFQESSSHF